MAGAKRTVIFVDRCSSSTFTILINVNSALIDDVNSTFTVRIVIALQGLHVDCAFLVAVDVALEVRLHTAL